MKKKQTFIYAFQIGVGGPIKIGVTENVEKRFKNIAANIPWDLNRIVVVEGSLRDEVWIHRKLSRYQIKGEWFEDNEFVREVLRNIADPLWTWPGSTRIVYRQQSYANAREMQRLAKEALGAAFPGEKVGQQIQRAAQIIGDKIWRVRSAWYGEASDWSEAVTSEFRSRCLQATIRRAAA